MANEQSLISLRVQDALEKQQVLYQRGLLSTTAKQRALKSASTEYHENIASSMRKEGIASIFTAALSVAVVSYFLYHQMDLNKAEVYINLASRMENIPSKLLLQPSQQKSQGELELTRIEQRNIDTESDENRRTLQHLIEQVRQMANNIPRV